MMDNIFQMAAMNSSQGNGTDVLPSNYIYVGKNGNDSTGNGSANKPYLTVSKAISVANSGTTIFTFPGTYNESLTLKAGVNITSPAVLSTYISGNHISDFTGTVVFENIVLTSPSGNTLTFSGSGNKNLQFYSSSVNSTSGHSINWTNTNASSKINFIDCTVNVTNSGTSAKAIYSTTGANGGIIANTTSFKINNPNNICLEIGGAVTFTHTADTITGQIVINNTASVTIGNVAMTTTSVPCLITNSSGTTTLLNVISTTSNAYAFGGTVGSIIVFMGIIYGGIGTGASNITAVPLQMAPIRIRPSALYSTVNDGTFEYNGTDLYFSKGSTRYKVTMTSV
jgi:hypothetical protein